MHRLFVALRPPPSVRARLMATMGGIPGARWQSEEQLHVTLRFIGEVAPPAAEMIAAEVQRLSLPVVEACLAGVGRFDTRGRTHALWAGLAPRAPLAAMFHRVDRLITSLGLTPERRAYLPHVTLARFSGRGGNEGDVAKWLAENAALTSDPFALEHLMLYESHLGHEGARYQPVLRVPLTKRGG